MNMSTETPNVVSTIQPSRFWREKGASLGSALFGELLVRATAPERHRARVEATRAAARKWVDDEIGCFSCIDHDPVAIDTLVRIVVDVDRHAQRPGRPARMGWARGLGAGRYAANDGGAYLAAAREVAPNCAQPLEVALAARLHPELASVCLEVALARALAAAREYAAEGPARAGGYSPERGHWDYEWRDVHVAPRGVDWAECAAYIARECVLDIEGVRTARRYGLDVGRRPTKAWLTVNLVGASVAWSTLKVGVLLDYPTPDGAPASYEALEFSLDGFGSYDGAFDLLREFGWHGPLVLLDDTLELSASNEDEIHRSVERVVWRLTPTK